MSDLHADRPPPPPPLELEVRGRPVPKGAVTAFAVKNKNTGKIRAVVVQGGDKKRRSKMNEWQSAIQDAALVAMGVRELEVARFAGVAVVVELEFRMGRPKGHYGTGRNAGKLKADAPEFPTTAPDVDKLARAALDALIGTAFDDDSRVTRLEAEKVFADDERPEGLRIRVWARAMAGLDAPQLRIVPGSVRAQGGPGTLGESLGLATARLEVVRPKAAAQLELVRTFADVTTPTARATETAELPPSPVTTPTERVRALLAGSQFEAEALALGKSSRPSHAIAKHATPAPTDPQPVELVYIQRASGDLDYVGEAPVDYRALETLDSIIARGDRAELARRFLEVDVRSPDHRRILDALADRSDPLARMIDAGRAALDSIPDEDDFG